MNKKQSMNIKVQAMQIQILRSFLSEETSAQATDAAILANVPDIKLIKKGESLVNSAFSLRWIKKLFKKHPDWELVDFMKHAGFSNG
jgi:hypothetical protein